MQKVEGSSPFSRLYEAPGVCREHQVAETVYYGWRDRLLEGGRGLLRAEFGLSPVNGSPGGLKSGYTVQLLSRSLVTQAPAQGDRELDSLSDSGGEPPAATTRFLSATRSCV
jgi:hypothetical protein